MTETVTSRNPNMENPFRGGDPVEGEEPALPDELIVGGLPARRKAGTAPCGRPSFGLMREGSRGAGIGCGDSSAW